ncbi:GNAT family N-acetyltransferase [Asticcacaulis sp. YBE204]|uniref:GNAT family N-acetyltransferase n=1 Tax=Asticcacaulis sp. YBE204 TaxID=1282363 RepID=UPI0003C3E00F|nr:GNAT family N-acetyltransferase [Asticcacaulis sp. YBE204]ESQ80938.1 hypothetical protein AEYBE204_01035 [Asticcacaulis sp. YBE204]
MKHIHQIREFDPRLVEIHAKSFDFGWKDSEFLEYLNKPHHVLWGLYTENSLQSFVLSSEIADEAEILTIATDPAERRQGHAQALLTHLLAHLKTKGTRSLFLEVALDNPAAIAFYEGLDFQTVGKRKSYYSRRNGPPVDARILSLAI